MIFEITDTDTYAYVTYDEYYYDDVEVHALVENRGVNTNNISLLCRYDEDLGWYEFNMTNGGLYYIYRYQNGSGYGNPIANGGSNYINQGKDYNEYAIRCKGNNLTLWINGKETANIRDNTFKEGLIGISVSSFNVTPVIVEFDYVDIIYP